MLKLQEKLISSFKDHQLSINGSETKSLCEMRTKAFTVFEKQGFPTTKDEEWKYTSLNKPLKRDYDLKSKKASSITSEQVDDFLCAGIDSYKLVFIDGTYNPSLSSLPSEDHIFIGNIKDAFDGSSHIFNKYYGKIVQDQQSMVALNTAFAQEGAFVYIKARAVINKLIQILYISTESDTNQMHQVRNLFVLEDGSEAQILERHQSLSSSCVFTNVVTESYVGKEGRFKHFKLQNDRLNTTLIDSTFVKQGSNSSALVDTFAFGGDLIRNNLHFEFQGEHAEAHMDAMTLLKGTSMVDHHTFVDHAVPNCQSNQLYKGIYDEKSRGVFNGKVLVQKDAQKTNAFQQNNNLLLTDYTNIDSKPQLEIFADDVACSHGCTIGQIDEEALFYMQTRGIPLKEAKAFLMFAFSADSLKNISIPELKEQLINIVAKELKVELELNELKH